MRKIVFLLLLGFVAASLREPASSQTPAPSPPAADANCANPALPAEILSGTFAAGGRPLRVVTVRAPAARLVLAVAADPQNRDLGLMCVTHLRAQHGMVFVFPQNAEWDFWMKNTLIPLDMIWANGDGTVTAIAPNVPASSRATVDAQVARRTGTGSLTLELNAGEAQSDGIAVGTRLVVPRLHATR